MTSSPDLKYGRVLILVLVGSEYSDLYITKCEIVFNDIVKII